MDLMQMAHLEDLQSRSHNGQATIELTFAFGSNTHLAFIEVNEKIDQMMSALPRDLPLPQVIRAFFTIYSEYCTMYHD